MDIHLTALYLAALGVFAHIAGERLPRARLDPARFPFRAMAWEREGRAYDRLGIRCWKDRVPDMSRICTDMLPKRLRSTASSAELFALVRETCVAEAVHLALIPLSLPMLALLQRPWETGAWLLYNLIGNLPFILIQRCNRPQLLRLAAVRARTEVRRNASAHPQL